MIDDFDWNLDVLPLLGDRETLAKEGDNMIEDYKVRFALKKKEEQGKYKEALELRRSLGRKATRRKLSKMFDEECQEPIILEKLRERSKRHDKKRESKIYPVKRNEKTGEIDREAILKKY